MERRRRSESNSLATVYEKRYFFEEEVNWKTYGKWAWKLVFMGQKMEHSRDGRLDIYEFEENFGFF